MSAIRDDWTFFHWELPKLWVILKSTASIRLIQDVPYRDCTVGFTSLTFQHGDINTCKNGH